MKKLDKFIEKHLANIAFVITFTIIIVTLIVVSVTADWQMRWDRTIVCCVLLLCDWIYLFRCYIKME